MPTMPNVVGMTLEDAQDSLKSSGVLVTSSIGYFGTWPITVNWTATSPFDVVTGQSPASTTTVSANSSVTLTVSNPTLGVVYP